MQTKLLACLKLENGVQPVTWDSSVANSDMDDDPGDSDEEGDKISGKRPHAEAQVQIPADGPSCSETQTFASGQQVNTDVVGKHAKLERSGASTPSIHSDVGTDIESKSVVLAIDE